MYNSRDNYPIVLKASHIAEILEVSEPTAYKLMRQEGFPLINGMGRNMRTLREKFFLWLEERSEMTLK